MSNLKEQLIRLGSKNPELRDHLRSVLSALPYDFEDYDGTIEKFEDSVHALNALVTYMRGQEWRRAMKWYERLPRSTQEKVPSKVLNRIRDGIEQTEMSLDQPRASLKQSVSLVGMKTPWGPAQNVNEIDGTKLFFVDTLGHGGMAVGGSYLKGLSSQAKTEGILQGGFYWFEEDIAWMLPVYESDEILRAWHQKFGSTLTRDKLEEQIARWFPKYLENHRKASRRRVAMKIPKFGDRYLDTFFREKDLRERRYEVEAPDGTPHSIPTGVVLEYIAQTHGREREQIKDIVRNLDLRNGDFYHFFEHLAKAIAANY